MMKQMELDNIKTMHGPLGTIMMLGYVVATVLTLYLEKVLGFLGLSMIAVTALSLLMAIDFATGVWKSKRLKVKITSTTGKEGFYEKVVSLIALLVLALLLKMVGVNTHALVNVIMVIGGLIEAYSIFGNLYSIRTRKPVTEQDALTIALLVARKKLYKWLVYLWKKGDPEDGTI